MPDRFHFILAVVPSVVLYAFIYHSKKITASMRYLNSVLTSPPFSTLETTLHNTMDSMGVPPPYPSLINILFVLVGVLLSLAVYHLLIRRSRAARRRALQEELEDAHKMMEELQEELHKLNREEALENVQGKATVRIFMEGAFDLMHFGHMNAFRLGKSLGTELVVGVNSSESITECKGFAPVMTDEERCAAVRGCRFVDEVVEKTPYVMTPEYLEWIIKEYNIDYVVHGNDPCIVNGKDVYEDVKRLGKFQYIPRTEGVSTTDFVGRMLLCSSMHHDNDEERKLRRSDSGSGSAFKLSKQYSTFQYNPSSRFNTMMSVMRSFSKGIVDPPEGAKIVYMDGAWDCFHAGHISSIKRARELGDYIIIGVFSDSDVNKYRGSNFPILNLNERVLSVLGCKYVDDVLIDAPWHITRDMIASLNINVVAHGTVHDASTNLARAADYQVPKELGIYREVTSESTLTISEIIERINNNREQFVKKMEKKAKAEEEYYDERYGRKKEESSQ